MFETKAFAYECADCSRRNNRRHDHACPQIAADDLVLGGVFDGQALQRHLGAAIAGQTRPRLISHRLDVVPKLRRAMVNPGREPLSRLVEADETIIPFRTKNDPIVMPAGRGGVGKMLEAGAVEIDGGKPQRARLKVIEGFGKHELHAFVLGAVAPHTQPRRRKNLNRHSTKPLPTPSAMPHSTEQIVQGRA